MNITGNYRLSPQQKHLWMQQSREKDGAPYRVQCEILIEGKLLAEHLKKTLDRIVERHEILRTVLHTPDGVDIPLQSVFEKLEPVLFEKNLSNLPADEQTTAIDNIFEETKKHDFDAENNPLVTFLVHLNADRHVLVISLPALYSDIQSLSNLTCEIAELYNSSQTPSQLEEPFQYVDFSEWQNEITESEESDESRDYWDEQKIKSDFSLYTEDQNLSKGKFEPQVLIKKIDRETIEQINVFATNSSVLPGTFLLACWQIVVWHLSGESDFAIGLYVDGRKFQEMDAAIGLLGRYVPLQAKICGNIRFNDFLKQAKNTADRVINCQEFFDWKKLKNLSGAQIDEPVLSFCFEHFKMPSDISAGDNRFQIKRQYSCTEKFKVKLSCVESDDSINAEFHYDADKFRPEQIERLADSFNQLLDSAVNNPTAEIAQLKVTSANENLRLLEEYNQTNFEYRRDVSAHQLFEECAAQNPDQIAVVCEDEKLTYAELNARANQLARHLQSLGVKPETLCGICVERSVEMVVSVLAVFKAGAAYVPLDPAYPADRLAYMLRDAQPELLITQQQTLGKLPENQAKAVLIDTESAEISTQSSAENLDVAVESENLAYLIYTSGSTGNPKGVMISHANLASYVQSLPVSLGIQSSDRYLHTASISFSSSVRQMMLPLANGATIVIAKSERIRNPLSLFELIKQQRATVIDFVPSFWRSCLYALDNAAKNDLRELMDNDVRLALSASEPLPADIPRELKAKFKPEVRLINMLGQTETTGIIAVYPIENANEQLTEIVPAGHPIGNTKIYLLDENLHPVPFGATGEIYIGGAGVGRGYLNQTDLTAEKFIADPFGSGSNAKLYKTGDFGRYSRNGQIEFLGRIDNQVKIRGHRVELGAIEAALRQMESVHEAVVALKTDAQNGSKLVAYVVPKTANAPTFAGRERYGLPNNMFIAQQNKYETDFFYEQIFKDQTNFKHGIKLEDGDCVVDVGANIGFFTMFVQQRWKNIKGYAFEPIPAIYETLNINVKLYGNDTKTFRCGLAEESKEVVFTYYPNSSTQSGRYADEQEEREVLRSIIGNQEIENGVAMSDQYFDRLVENRIHGEKVVCPLKTLSQVMRENNIEQIDLLKIDAEKSEFDVLRGIETEDWKKIKQITIEAHDIDGQLKQLIELLENNGFTVFAEEDSFIKNSGLYNVYATREPQSDLPPAQAGVPYAIPFDENKILTVSDLRQHLKDKLPEYYLPSNFVLMEQFPLSPNGKVDREALPAPEENRSTVEKGFVAPNDELEIRLTKIWESLLGVTPIGIRDNFFDLGGHSLLAVKLFTQIEKLFGKNLPLATLFEAPTVEQLAVLLRQKGWMPSWSSLVTLQAGGTKRPFFCVHALGGNVLEYQPLARFLGSDQPFYALQSYGLNKNHQPHTTIEEMAAHYIKEMQTVQPQGPYLLGGRSLGGTVAFEMACRLKEQNQEVALLGLLDTDPMGYHKLLPESNADFHKLHRFAKRTRGHLTNLATLSFGGKVDYFRGKAKYVPGKIKNKLWQAIYKLYAKTNRPLPQILQSVQEFNFMAVMNYVPKIYPGKVTLFWASEDLRGSYDVQEGWNFLAGAVETHNIPGNHLNIVKEPYVQELADELKQCIQKSTLGESSNKQAVNSDVSVVLSTNSENYEQLWNGSQPAIGNV
ncbi:MAG: amino acid adenylation domain-containing protein [Pyrinomonadaceae bacterium]|nr:amino acid adenylation domain-containing protein [Pyrinomonadaceae bacterium]